MIKFRRENSVVPWMEIPQRVGYSQSLLVGRKNVFPSGGVVYGFIEGLEIR